MTEEYKNPNVDFVKTDAYRKVKEFIYKIDLSIKENKMPRNEIIIMPVLLECEKAIEETELSKEPCRFANKGMVTVIEKIEKLSDEKCNGNLYLKESFGNKVRMDYGTGHELNFLCFILTQVKQNEPNLFRAPNSSQEEGIIDSHYLNDVEFILDNMWYYMKLIRRHIKKFNIEPAGARGCWSVNDFSLMGHVMGSGVAVLEPTLSDFYLKYKDIWSEAIKRPNPLLFQIIALDARSANLGLIKMYFNDVLEKFVVTQHFIFGEILSGRYL